MSLLSLRVALLTVIFASSGLALADQKIKTKSNIKNDRVAQSSSCAADAVDCKSAAESNSSAAPKEPAKESEASDKLDKTKP